MIEYKGYVASIRYEPEDNVLVGKVEDVRDLIAFEGTSVEEMDGLMKEAVDGYLEYCKERGIEPAKPYSGNLRVRMGSDIHRALALAAASAGKSMNEFVVSTLTTAVMPNYSSYTNKADVQSPKREGRRKVG